jgi:hypothetical protein
MQGRLVILTSVVTNLPANKGRCTVLVATYKTKALLKAAVGKPLRFHETSMFGPEYSDNGKFSVVGPGAYDRKWYATVTMQNGLIKAVK